MNTNTSLSKGSWIQQNQRQAARAGILLLLLLLLTLPAVVQAQFTFTTNNSTITITRYTGPGGAVTIPDTINGLPVTSIGVMAFNNCTSLTGVTIPDSATNIGDWAFDGCTNLTSITIPDSVTSIGQKAFLYCSSLAAITVNPQNTQYSSVDGVLFNNNQTTLIAYPGGKVGAYTIANSVTKIEDSAFLFCTRLTSVTIPDSVASIGVYTFSDCTSLTNATIGNGVTNNAGYVFFRCTSLTSVTIGSNVTSIGSYAFAGCTSLTSITIPASVNSLWPDAFAGCTSLTSITIPNSVATIWNNAFTDCYSLTAVYFSGNPPSLPDSSVVFFGDTNATVYYLPGTTGWGATFGGRPAVLWNPPTLLTSPRTQTAEVGSAVGLRVQASGSSPLFCLWYLNSTNLLSCSTNRELNLTNLQLSQSGAYTVVISNASGTVTSAPVLLNVIAAVERRPVPGVKVTAETASLWNVDYADSPNPAPTWTTLGSVSLTGTLQYCFDLTFPLPPQRFYRAWQTGAPGMKPSLDLHLVPAVTLTGTIGHSVRLDYINQFGPIDAWVTLATVPLTNTSQLYFDTSAPGQPQRLYRLVPSP